MKPRKRSRGAGWPAPMLIASLKWSQLAVAIATTVFAALFYPGIMVVIPVAAGLIYVVWAIRAIRDRRLSVWLAFLMSVTVAALSATVLVGQRFDVLPREVAASSPPAVFGSRGEVIGLDQVPAEWLARREAAERSSSRMQTILVALFLVAAVGASMVVVMHAFAWQWLIFGKGRGEPA